MFSYVLCVGPKDAGIGTWPTVGTLEFDGEQLAVQAVPAIDASSIERASQEFLSKYRSSPYAASIVRQDILETTLRLDPR